MRIMILGAASFIGRQIVAELLGAGHEVVGVARSTRALAQIFPTGSFLALDLAKMLRAEHWSKPLHGIDAVVNAAGVLREHDLKVIHETIPSALCAAAQAMGAGCMVLISAISARSDVATAYAATKLAGECTTSLPALE